MNALDATSLHRRGLQPLACFGEQDPRRCCGAKTGLLRRAGAWRGGLCLCLSSGRAAVGTRLAGARPDGVPFSQARLRWPPGHCDGERCRRRSRRQREQPGRALRDRSRPLAKWPRRGAADPCLRAARAAGQPPARRRAEPGEQHLARHQAFPADTRRRGTVPARCPRSRSDLRQRRPCASGPAAAPVQPGAPGERGAAAVDSYRQHGHQFRAPPMSATSCRPAPALRPTTTARATAWSISTWP